MTRFAALLCFGLGLGLSALAPQPGLAQDSDRCFPWQEFRNGTCIAKPVPLASPPTGTQVPSAPAAQERSETTTPVECPANTHIDAASGVCVADASPPPATPPRALITITCIGGTASNGQCACPAGFQLMPSGTDPGGTCVRTNAENCQGGAMTVTGTCLCDGQVTMSGQVYDLEFSRGKCVPKRCPRDGTCVTAAAKPDTDASPKLSSEERPRECGRGMVATRHGCVSARHRSHSTDSGAYFRITPNYPSPMHY